MSILLVSYDPEVLCLITPQRDRSKGDRFLRLKRWYVEISMTSVYCLHTDIIEEVVCNIYKILEKIKKLVSFCCYP